MWVKLHHSNFEWVENYENTNNNKETEHYILLQAAIQSVQMTESNGENNEKYLRND